MSAQVVKCFTVSRETFPEQPESFQNLSKNPHPFWRSCHGLEVIKDFGLFGFTELLFFLIFRPGFRVNFFKKIILIHESLHDIDVYDPFGPIHVVVADIQGEFGIHEPTEIELFPAGPALG